MSSKISKLTGFFYLFISCTFAIAAVGTGVLIDEYDNNLKNGMPRIFGDMWGGYKGVYDTSDIYRAAGILNCSVDLLPVDATEISNISNTLAQTLFAEGFDLPGWSFSSSANDLSAGSLVMNTYDATASPEAPQQAAVVGAHVQVEYVPGAGDPNTNIHWIQVVTNNHDIRMGGAGVHGPVVTHIDRGGAATPYYDTRGSAEVTPCPATFNDGCDFFDFPRRGDVFADHTWTAELYIAEETMPGQVIIYTPGISYGWENSCQIDQEVFEGFLVKSNTPEILTSLISIEPESTHTLTTFANNIEIILDGISYNASVSSFNVQIDIGEEKDIQQFSEVTITGGSGTLNPFSIESNFIPNAGIVVNGGFGEIFWGSSEITATLDLTVSAPGFSDIQMQASAYGSIINQNQIELNINSVAAMPSPSSTSTVAVPTLTFWAQLLLALLFGILGWHTLRQSNI